MRAIEDAPIREAATDAAPSVPPKGLTAAIASDAVYFHWENAKGSPSAYRVKIGEKSGQYDHTFEQVGTEKTRMCEPPMRSLSSKMARPM